MLVSNTFAGNPILFIPLVALALIVTIGFLSSSTSPPPSYLGDIQPLPAPPSSGDSPPSSHWRLGSSRPHHPIDDLLHASQDRFEKLLRDERSVATLKKAAATYRKKRGRHPPPDFDKWFEFAQSKKALVMEELFDQIYHDLEPFWSLKPAQMRDESLQWPFLLSIRDGKAEKRAARPVSGEWLMLWLKMLDAIPGLPDVDLMINALDESRVMVPWEDMNDHMTLAQDTRSTTVPKDRSQIVTKFPALPPISFEADDIPLKGLKLPKGEGPWNQEIPIWNLTRAACRPGSPGRLMSQDEDFSMPPTFPSGFPNGSYQGYVSNWTASKDVCAHSHLGNTYGLFVNPRYNSINTTLVPLFSGCKVFGVNNEILLPAAKYFSEEEDFDFDGQGVAWESKRDVVVWRGQATGGAHKKENWIRFHRHRFAAMTNASLLAREERSQPRLVGNLEQALLAEKQQEEFPPPHNFPVPSSEENVWDLSALKTTPTSMGDWLTEKTDVGFHHMMCAPWVWSVLGNGKKCAYMDPYFKVQNKMKMEDQFGYKYLPDIDGNSYSGRYRAFLKSNSLPIKSTIWSEWHDSRLIPWKHFVPMDNTFVDFWGIMEYFLGYGFREGESQDPMLRKAGHDDVAKTIAEEGRLWAEKVLREEDMLVYIYRLILEYKRLSSDEREKMMWVDDLL